MSYVSAALFFAATGSHFLLTPYWLKRVWGRRFSTPEEWCFQSIVCGFGLLQVVLHVLACTVGISLPAGLVALTALHLLILAWVTRWQAAPEGALPSGPNAAADAAEHISARQRGRRPVPRKAGAAAVVPPSSLSLATLAQLPLATLLGVSGIGAVVFSWLQRSVQSMQITGLDSNHYHVPYAVNFAHGFSPFGYIVLGDMHTGPVGGSILNAWFFQAFSGPLCLDLVNLLPFLLLLVSLVYLFTLVTGERGWEWVPVVFLLLVTTKLFRTSLYISADLFYAATFAAAFTQLCAMWVRRKGDTYDWTALALAVGMLTSSKTQGPVSAVLLVTFAGAAALCRSFVLQRRAPRFAASGGLTIACVGLFTAAGGIWVIRNWLYFGSPIAPAGLHLFGITIFQGRPTTGGLATGEVAQTVTGVRSVLQYLLPNDFLARSQEWMGAWPAYLSVGLVILLADAVYQRVRGGHVTERTRSTLFVLFFFLTLALAHSHLLIRAHGPTVFDALDGQMLRYVIPIYGLFPLIAYAGFFTDSLARLTLPVKWLIVLPGLVYVVSQFNNLTRMSPQWISAHGAEDLIEYSLLPLVALVVAPWCMPLPDAWKRVARYTSAAALGLSFVAFIAFAVGKNADLHGLFSGVERRQLAHFQRTGSAPNAFVGVLMRTLVDQQRRAVTCERSRFFMMSFFPYPLAVQDPDYNNLTFYLPSGATPWAQWLRSNEPGRTQCDYVVAVHREETTYGDHYTPVSVDEIKRWLPTDADLEEIGDSARYRVYRVVAQ